MYQCDICSYQGNFLSNLIAHKKSKRHLKMINNKKDIDNIANIVNKKYICNKCNFETIHRSSFSRHNKMCIINKTVNTDYDKDKKIDNLELEKKIIQKEKELEIKEKNIYINLEKEKNEIINTLLNFINLFIDTSKDTKIPEKIKKKFKNKITK
jgi:hypothetical protein